MGKEKKKAKGKVGGKVQRKAGGKVEGKAKGKVQKKAKISSSAEESDQQHVCEVVGEDGFECGRTFGAERHLLGHMNRKHGIVSRNHHGPCKIKVAGEKCGIIVQTGQGQTHRDEWHTIVECPDPSCRLEFEHKKLLDDHVREQHEQIPSATKQLYVCELVDENGERCGRIYEDERHLDIHKNRKHGVICPNHRACTITVAGELCGIYVQTGKGQTHRDEWHTIVECPDPSCKLEFEHKKLLDDHIREQHEQIPLETNQPHVCELVDENGVQCGKKFPTSRSLKMHRSKSHDFRLDRTCQIMIATDRKCEIQIPIHKNDEHVTDWHQSIDCEYPSCSVKFNHKELLYDHYRDDHKEGASDDSSEEEFPTSSTHVASTSTTHKSSQIQSAQKKQYKCKLVDAEGVKCRLSFSERNELLSHFGTYHNVPAKGRCKMLLTPTKQCGILIHRCRDLHISTWHQKVKCNNRVCGMTFHHNLLLMEHYKKFPEHKQKLSNQLYFCDLECDGGEKCGLKFGSLHHLQWHKRGHSHNQFVTNGLCEVMVAGKMCGKKIKHGPMEHMSTWHSKTKCMICGLEFDHLQLKHEHHYNVHRTICKNRRIGCLCHYDTMEKLLEHEKKCDPANRPLPCKYGDCLATFISFGNLQTHLYLTHSLSVIEVRAHLGITAVKPEEDDKDEEDEPDLPTKRISGKTIPIPIDEETGHEFEIFKFGVPKWKFPLLHKGLFTVLYHYGLRVPMLTYQLLIPDFLSPENKQGHEGYARPNFRVDTKIEAVNRRRHEDFVGVETHRGHMVPYSDYMFDPDTARKTCMLSNVIPMLPSFNNGSWKRVETKAAKFAKKHSVTIIVTVAMFREPVETVGPEGKEVPLPNRMGKILIGLNPTTKLWDRRVYDVPHRPFPRETKLSEFYGDLQAIEEQLGIVLFPLLDDTQIGVDEQGIQQELLDGQLHLSESTIDVQ